MRLVFTKINHKTNYFEINSGVAINIDNIWFFSDVDIEEKDKDMVWQIEPNVHFPYFGRCKVGMRLKELEMNKETKEYDFKVYKKDKKSQFRLSTKVLKMIVNLEACIIDEIEKQEIDGLYNETFIVNYDMQTEYISLGDINDRLLKYLRKFSELEPKINLDTVKLASVL